METKARYTLVGLFTIVGIILVLGGVLWLGKLSSANKDWRYYVVEFRESVSGLSKGSAVQYSGLKIGEVNEIRLGKNPNNVYAYIKVGKDIPIKEDVIARLSVVGITGQAVIAMSGGTAERPNLVGEELSLIHI